MWGGPLVCSWPLVCGQLADGVRRHTVAACGECLVLLVAALVRLFAVTGRGQLLAVVVAARGRRLHAIAARWLVAVAAWGMRLFVAQMWLMARDVRRGGRLLAAGGRQLFSMAWGRWLVAALGWCPATGRVRHPVTVFVYFVYCCSCNLGLGQAAARGCGPEQAAVHGYGCRWLHGVCFVLGVSGSSQSRLVVGILCSGKSLSWGQVGILLGSACPSESESEAQDLLPPRLVVLNGVTADSSGSWLVVLRSRPGAGGCLRSQPLSRL